MKKLLKQKIYLSLVGVIIIFFVFGAYLITASLDTPLNPNDTKRLKVQMASTGGLFEGSAVTYRGVKIGKVSSIDLLDNGAVEAEVALVTKMDIPASSAVRVRSLSPVGEQYLDFQPRTESGPFMESGDVIEYPVECLPVARAEELGLPPDKGLKARCDKSVRVTTPETLSSTVINIKALLDQIDPNNVKTALSEISVGLKDTGEGIGQLIDRGDRILSTIEANWPMTQRLLRNGNTVLRIAPGLESEIAATSQSLQQFAQFLREFDPTARRLLDNAPKQFKQVESLLDDANEILPGLLDRSIDLNDILAARDPHLRELFDSYGSAVGNLGTIVHGNELHFDVYMTEQKLCSYGNTRRDPTDATRHPMQTAGACSGGLDFLRRGAAHAPAPLW
jgi:ABC-type transporter Mla subunit MlaD